MYLELALYQDFDAMRKVLTLSRTMLVYTSHPRPAKTINISLTDAPFFHVGGLVSDGLELSHWMLKQFASRVRLVDLGWGGRV